MEFLGEQVEFLHQQLRMDGFAPDLVFKDGAGAILLVEVQLGRLDRYHLYKMVEYRDLYLERHADSEVRLVLIAEELEPRYSTLIKTHKIDLRVFSRKALREMLDRLVPDAAGDTSDFVQPNRDGRLSVRRLLEQLSRESRESPDSPMASDRCVVVAAWPHFLSEGDKRRTLALKLPRGPASLSQDDPEWLPELWILDKACFDNLDRSGLSLLNAWMCVINTHESDPEFVFSDASLCHNAFGDDYRDYLRGRLKHGFIPLANRYGLDDGWDVELMAHDLRLFADLSLFALQSGEVRRDRLFDDFEIVGGVGSLEKMWLARMADQSRPYAPSALHELSIQALESLKRVSCSVTLRGLDSTVWLRLSSILCWATDFDLANRDAPRHSMFASKPVRLSRLDPHVLGLATKYLPLGHQ